MEVIASGVQNGLFPWTSGEILTIPKTIKVGFANGHGFFFVCFFFRLFYFIYHRAIVDSGPTHPLLYSSLYLLFVCL